MVDWAALTAPSNPPDLAAVAAGFVDPATDRAVKGGYLRWFPGAGVLLDVGCGRGSFLDVARAAGREAIGVDASTTAIEACVARGHDAVVADAVDHLAERAARGERFAGVLVAHLVEHLEPSRAAILLQAASGVLRPGGRVVVVTPNFRNAIVREETFWLDPTHVRPYPRALLERLFAAAGLRVVESHGDPSTRPVRPAWKRALATLRSALSGVDRSGPMDWMVVGERG